MTLYKLTDIHTQFEWCNADFTATLLDGDEGIYVNFTYDKRLYLELYIVKQNMGAYYYWNAFNSDGGIVKYNTDFNSIVEEKYRELTTMRDFENVVLKGDSSGNI